MAYTFRPYDIPTYQSLERQIAQQYQLPKYESLLSQAQSQYLQNLFALPQKRKQIRETELQKYGIPELEKEYSDIRRQIQERESQYEQQQGKITEKPLSMAAITGQQAALARARAIDLNSLYTKRDVIAGDLDRANQRAKEAIDYALQDEAARLAAFEQQVNIRAQQLGYQKDKYQVALEDALKERQLKLQSNIQLQDLTRQTWLELQQQYPRAVLKGNMTIEQMFDAVRPFASERERLQLEQMKAQVAAARAQIAAASRTTTTPLAAWEFKTDTLGDNWLVNRYTGEVIKATPSAIERLGTKTTGQGSQSQKQPSFWDRLGGWISRTTRSIKKKIVGH